MKRDYAFYKTAFAGRQMPFAFVDLDLLAENTRQIVARARGKHIRVASKSIRCVAVLRRIMAADPAFIGVMCFTPDEALYLSQQGFDNLLIGYPCWNTEQICAVCEETRRGATITLMIDSVDHIHHLESLAASTGVTLPVCIDLDMSVDFPGLHFGAWRSSIATAGDALRLYDQIAGCPHLRLDGIMGYEAQIAGVGDNAPGQSAKNRLIRALKRRSVGVVARRRAEIVAALGGRGAQLRFVNGGGTGSLETTSSEPVVSEVTAGSGFYAPALFDYYRAFRHLPAAGFAIEIVRQPGPGIYTCLGGGYIASGSVGANKQPLPYLPEGARLTALEGAGEVQTPILYDGREKLSLGDPIFLRHSKAGELCERFNTLLLVEGGNVIDKVTTYRGDGKAFL